MIIKALKAMLFIVLIIMFATIALSFLPHAIAVLTALLGGRWSLDIPPCC